MTKEQLNHLVTQGDLQLFYEKLTSEISTLICRNNRKEFYSPREFSEISGMKYSTVIHYLNTGKLQARQAGERGSWLIYRAEVDKLVKEAKENTI